MRGRRDGGDIIRRPPHFVAHDFAETSDKQTILIVDDTPQNVELLGADYRIKTATSGERALKICAETPPDLVLLDIMMPDK